MTGVDEKVHVVVHSAQAPAVAPIADFELLDAVERARAASFVREADVARFVAAHALLRRVVGATIDVDPAEVRFGRAPCIGCGAPHGRPLLVDEPDVHFSLSHSGSEVLVALCGRPLGADVEQIVEPRVVDDVEPSLHPLERAELANLVPSDRPVHFTRLWVRKEALLKGLGVGLLRGLDRDYVGADSSVARPPGWHLTDLPATPGYAAAIAVAGADGGLAVRVSEDRW